MSQKIEECLKIAQRLADTAGEILRQNFRRPGVIEHKEDASPVTATDRAVEKALRGLLHEHFPEHGVVGEEEGASAPDAEYVWVLDPIDGTRSFIAGVPLFTTLISLLYDGLPILGIIDQPILHERWIGQTHMPQLPCTFNGKPTQSRPCADLSQAVLSTTSPYLFDDSKRERFETLRQRTSSQIYGGDAYAYGLVASGHIDIVIESGLKPYDMMALVPVLQASGASVTDWEGEPVTPQSNGDILACGDPSLHTKVLKLL